MNNFAFIVACEEYKDPLHNLVGVEKDAELLKDTLIRNCSCDANNIFMCTCCENSLYHPNDPSSLVQMIIDAAKKFANQKFDIVYFYFSGHGFSKNRQLFLALKTTDVRLGYSNIINDISVDIIMMALETSKLGKAYVCFFDTCQTELYTKDISCFENNHNRFVTFYSCSYGSVSYLLPNGEGSLFTKCLVDALEGKSKCRTVAQVHSFIENIIEDKCKEYGSIQKPVTFLQNITLSNLIITNNKNIPDNELVGQTFSLGTYPQTSKGSRRKVKWIILEVTEKQIIAISQLILDVFHYHEEAINVEWEKSSIYLWLKTTMFHNLFSQDEIRLIKCISLLREDDARRLFKTNKSRKALASNYSLQKGIYTDPRFSDSSGEYGQWWLQNCTITNNMAKRVFCDGVIYPRGRKVIRTDIGVRPIIYMDISDYMSLNS